MLVENYLNAIVLYMYAGSYQFRSRLKLAGNSCLHAKLGLRIEDTQQIARVYFEF